MDFIHELSWIELVGAALSLVGVWLTARTNVWCWAVNICAAAVYVVFFASERLYAGAALQLVYVALGVYGWLVWSKDDTNGDEFAVQNAQAHELAAPLLLSGITALVVSFFLQRMTNAAFPILDSILTAFSLFATWMTARKFIENWFVWILTDAVYVWMFFTKQLFVTSALYALFCIFAVLGYQMWEQRRREQQPHPDSNL